MLVAEEEVPSHKSTQSAELETLTTHAIEPVTEQKVPSQESTQLIDFAAGKRLFESVLEGNDADAGKAIENPGKAPASDNAPAADNGKHSLSSLGLIGDDYEDEGFEVIDEATISKVNDRGTSEYDECAWEEEDDDDDDDLIG